MGTVASNITQTVSFCNTTGVIEREHNLYFVPQTRSAVGLLYKQLLFAQATVNTDYIDISLSQWKPEDRTLSIKGRVEDFRNATNTKPLNYAIVQQSILYTDNTRLTTYTAYFVVGARQNGIGGVTLDLEPDHFTNVFFLQRGSGLIPSNYDVFNNYIKNAYVERQHYDRTSYNSVVEKSIYKKTYWVDSDEIGGITIKVNLPKYLLGTSYTDYFVHIRSVKTPNGEELSYGTPYETEVDKGSYLEITEEFGIDRFEQTVSVAIEVTARYIVKRFTNDNIFANYEETFRYRRQYRDKKERVIYPLTDAEKTTIASNPEWSTLSSSLKEKILKQSIVVYHCTLKNNKLILPYRESGGYVHKGNFLTYPNSSVCKQMPDVFNIGCVVPEEYKQYERDIKKVFKYYAIKDTLTGRIKPTYNAMYQLTEQDKYPDYIASCFISRDDEVLNHITFESIVYPAIGTIYMPVINDVRTDVGNTDADSPIGGKMVDGLYMAVLPANAYVEPAISGDLSYSVSDSGALYFEVTVYGTGASTVNCIIYLMTSSDKQKITLNLSDSEVVTKTAYFEPVLTFSPYSFYSLSYLGNIEVPLNKNSYYQEPVIDLDYIISITESMKISVIPTYKVKGKYYKYYTETLSLTLNNEIIFASEVLDQYLIQNKAQMKNQYAINDTNLAKNIGTSALGGLTTGFGVGMMSGNPVAGVVSGLIGAGVGAIGSAITWAVNDKEIAMNQKSKIADVGNMPNNLKQTGTDIATDTAIGEMGLYLNHYTIDTVSYNNIAKYLERYGYLVNIYSELHCYDRKGWNFVKLIDFEVDKQMSDAQEESIRQIFKNGVTLLHEPSYLHSNTLHNYEVALDS